jgi:hypothetical protein
MDPEGDKEKTPRTSSWHRVEHALSMKLVSLMRSELSHEVQLHSDLVVGI